MTLDAVRAHLLKFQEFSDIGGGDRTAWGGFYLLSSEYVLRQLQGAGYDVTRHALQAFTMIGFGPSTLERTAPSAQVYAGE
ncbi:MAG TPA: hypothetical protein VMM12_06745 [Longimicrobiales bacterium]|nr:hypothetical protein [Longimicrobiales bacterium]